MSWLTSLINILADWLGIQRNKQLLDAGSAAQKVEQLTGENARLRNALKNSGLSDNDIAERLRSGDF